MALRLDQPVCQGIVQLGEIEFIGYGTVSPTIGKGLPRIRKISLLFDENKEKVAECVRAEAALWSKETTSPEPRTWRPKSANSASAFLDLINKTSTSNIWVFVAFNLVQRLHNLKGFLLDLVSRTGLKVWPFSSPQLTLNTPTTFLAP